MAALPGSQAGLEGVGVRYPSWAKVDFLIPTGTRDVEGRAVLLLSAHTPTWSHPQCSSHELTRLLLYLQSIPRFKGCWWLRD